MSSNKESSLKKVFIATLLVMMSVNATASYHGELTGNTAIEREIRWVWRHLPTFLISCKNSGSECADPAIQATLDQLIAYAPAWDSVQQNSWADLLKFVSEKDHTDLFSPNGSETHRLAVTNTQKYSVIYINSDRMQLPLETWVGILVHEAVHHMGVVDGADRYPDKVGAEIARHFKKQIQYSSLDQFKSPGSHTLAFNPTADLQETIGFISNGVRTSDIGWEPHPLHPVCANYEKVFRQFATAPSWRVNRMQPENGIVTVRGGGFVRTVCLNKATGQRRMTLTPLDASISLQYSKPLNLDHWSEETPTPIYTEEDAFGPSNNPQDAMFGQAQTFLIESIQNEQSTIEAGSVWKTTMTFRSVDGFQAASCQLFVAGSQYSYIGQDHLPGINNFDSCELKELGQGRWQVQGQTVIPANARPDMYYVPIVIFESSAKDNERTAVPTVPNFIRVTNKTAPPAPVIRGITINGAQPATSLGTLTLTSSYKVSSNQTFDIEYIVEGPQQAFDIWFDVDIWYLLPTEFGIARGTGYITSLPQVVLNSSITRVANGTKVSIKAKMVENLESLQIAGFKLRKFYMRTSDYSWVEIEMPGLHDHLIINDKFGK
jgi:hypothetical protein